jgi:hypothetical protein
LEGQFATREIRTLSVELLKLKISDLKMDQRRPLRTTPVLDKGTLAVAVDAAQEAVVHGRKPPPPAQTFPYNIGTECILIG